MEFRIGKNKFDNDRLFDEAREDDIWFHLADHPSPHMWVSSVEMEKSNIYNICLNLKKQTKYRKVGVVRLCYTAKKNLRKTNEIGKLLIVGKLTFINV